jgi:hypothetical protein
MNVTPEPSRELESTLKPARPAVSGKALPLPSRTREWETPAEPFEGGAELPNARPRE